MNELPLVKGGKACLVSTAEQKCYKVPSKRASGTMKCELLVVTETSSKIREQAAVRTFRLGHPLVWIKLYKPSILKAVKESLLQFQKGQSCSGFH